MKYLSKLWYSYRNFILIYQILNIISMKQASIWRYPYRYGVWIRYGIVSLSSIGCDPTYSDQQAQIDTKNASDFGLFGMLCEGPSNTRFEWRQKDLQALEEKKEEELKKILHIPQAVALSSAQCLTLKQQLKLGIEVMYDLVDLQQLLGSPFKALVKPLACAQDSLDPLLMAVIKQFKARVETILVRLNEANEALAAFEAIIDEKHQEKKHQEKSTDQAYIAPLIADIRQLLPNLESGISTYQFMKIEHLLFGDTCSCLSFVLLKIRPPITILHPTFYRYK